MLEEPTSDDLIFRRILQASKIRAFEQYLLDLFSEGRLSGTTHTSIGQEMNAVGVCEALQGQSIFVSNHRCHGHFLASGGCPKRLLYEILGDGRGVCGGVGGSQHLCIPDQFYSNGIQGGIVPLSAGLAWTVRNKDIYKGRKKLVTVFVGDGTFGQGVFYETMNLAKILSLPLLIVVEDNGIAQTTATDSALAGSISDRFKSFHWASTALTYPSASEVVTAINDIKDRVICGAPEALIIKTGRLAPHSKGDDTRSDPEIEYLHQLDPVQISIEKLNQFQKDSLNDEIEKFLGELNTIARQKREPCVMPTSENLTIETKLNDFSELDGRTFSQRLNNELAKYVNDHNNVVVVGEDIHDPYGGAFKITRGIQSKIQTRFFRRQ